MQAPPCVNDNAQGLVTSAKFSAVQTTAYTMQGSYLQVAQVLDARMYDCVCKFDKGQGGQSLQWAQVSGNASWINKAERAKQQQYQGKPSPWTQVVGKANWIRGNANIPLCVDDE